MIYGEAGAGVWRDILHLFVKWFLSRWGILTIHVEGDGAGVRLREVSVRGEASDLSPAVLPP